MGEQFETLKQAEGLRKFLTLEPPIPHDLAMPRLKTIYSKPEFIRWKENALYQLQTLKQEPRATLNMGESNVIPDPENSQFYIILSFDIPGFSDYEKTITLTFKQRN